MYAVDLVKMLDTVLSQLRYLSFLHIFYLRVVSERLWSKRLSYSVESLDPCSDEE